MVLARLMAGVALIGLMASPALAQNQDKTQPQQQQQQQTSAGQDQQQLAQQDKEFVEKAAGGGMAEVKLGKLAQEQAKSDQVKQFGQRMVDDHSQANDKLKTIAQQKNIDLPQKMPEEAQKTYDELQKKTGQEFDQAYMDTMVEDHKKDVDLFKKEAQGGQDQDLKQFAEQTLPTLQEHLDLAQKTQEQVTAANDSSTGGGAPTAGAAAAGGAAAVTAGEKQDMGAGATPPEGLKKTNQPMKDQAAGASSGSQENQQAATEPANPPAATEPSNTEQQAATEPAAPPAATEPSTEQQQAATEPAAQQVNADDVIGAKVVNNKGEQVGEIEDLVIDKDKVQYAVISVGGFLGIGEKHVVVPIEQLKLGQDQAYLTSAQTEDELKKLPEYNEDQYQSQKKQG